MPTLFILSGPEIGRTVNVEDGALLGRGNECDAVLHEGSVSRVHARLELGPGGWEVVDLDSRNGVHADGGRVARLALADGDLFQLGKLELRFRVEEEQQTSTPAPAVEVRKEPAQAAPLAAAPEEDFEDEIRLEGHDEELELEDPGEVVAPAPAPRSVVPPRQAHPSPERRSPERRSPEGPRPAASASTPRVDQRGGVLQYNKVPSRSGFGTADLAQYPVWVRALLFLLALLLFVLVFIFAFKGGSSIGGAEQSELYYDEAE